jgi:flagellar biosynthesis/type III secretory pathway protein FliH
VPRVRDFLYRFRPAGAPGAATPTGVPADRTAGLEAELAPVFAHFLDAENELAQLREQSERAAEEVRKQAEREAHTIVAAAVARQGAERAAAEQRLRQRLATEANALIAAAGREAAELRGRAARRLPGYVDHVVASVEQLIGDATTPDAAAPGEASR